MASGNDRLRKRTGIVAVGIVAAGILALLIGPLLAWQQIGSARATSLSNLRRIAYAAQLYAEDYDSALMAPQQRRADSSCLDWTQHLDGYGIEPETLDDPANSIHSVSSGLRDPYSGCKVRTAYALNYRFNGVFAPGPFPLDDLELPGQTALIVEAGPMWSGTGRAAADRPTPHPLARLAYDDTLDRYEGLVPYPSPHAGRLALAAADGHAATVRVEHYSASDGPHDRLFGRIGGDLYNWNGGHTNGHTDEPRRE